MTDMSIAEFILFMTQGYISCASIDEIERVGCVTLNDEERQILRALTKDYVHSWQTRPPKKRDAQKSAMLHKRALKRQKKHHEKIAQVYAQGADLLEEEARECLPLTDNLETKILLNYMASGSTLIAGSSLPDLVAQSRELAKLALEGPSPSEMETKNDSTGGGRRPDGLNELIAGFAFLYVRVGGKIAYISDPESEGSQRKIGPFHEAVKVLIDALPSDCPKLTLSAIAHRVYDRKLADGLTNGPAGRRKYKPSAVHKIISEQNEFRKYLIKGSEEWNSQKSHEIFKSWCVYYFDR